MAGIGSRGAAVIVDTILQTVATAVIVAAVAALLAATGLGADVGATLLDGQDAGAFVVLGLAVVGLFLVWFGYFVLFEAVWSGQTPGKRMLGLRVMRDNGYPVRAGDAVVRNLVRIVDALPSMYLVGLVVMLFNGRSKRLGDFAAGTVVVREGSTRGAGPGPVARVEDRPVRAALRGQDATLIRDFLLRRGTMDPGHRSTLAARLAGAVAARYGLEADRSAAGDEAFLEHLG